ncbi:cytochrome aa3 quinol oxidase subunit IV [Listeria booriae]|uniref:Quinol oxidase subunit 4 n=1 Tax=Listeria booriae TaxID=1552123 RepID=A0A7X1CBH5_9LIST|nr:cytochrome aa3 quinol oxidase subunit IV [Listeria booriae]MBC1359321.1 cytochrome aa3 quinol oxidase subunit IV [Listeria booriae]MBC1491225.1 cytochrome aa3 quinol oxidase subunit IV [Listeria booriae]MBC1502926.1 cytochrome aa3 quinol oxidase subunit IV [Listeria booriae]MBC1513090.1 cytochrome aa3 quinol oxidase subunit IV [Listeria booriae]MBC1524570.1 cytochrome aa3 quinol oxidase subunit IV [Listeria booriae]
MAKNKANTAHAEEGIPWKHIIGFALSIALTLLAVWVVFESTLDKSVIITVIFIFAFIQAALQLLMFMHMTEGKNGRIQVGNILFAAFIAIVVVMGSYWVMELGHMNHLM